MIWSQNKWVYSNIELVQSLNHLRKKFIETFYICFKIYNTVNYKIWKTNLVNSNFDCTSPVLGFSSYCKSSDRTPFPSWVTVIQLNRRKRRVWTLYKVQTGKYSVNCTLKKLGSIRKISKNINNHKPCISYWFENVGQTKISFSWAHYVGPCTSELC